MLRSRSGGCHFYKELHTILGSNPTSTTKSPVNTLGGLESATSRLNPEGEVVEEEVELEDEVKHTAESSSGMASQDLFSTPEGSSQSQHSTLAHMMQERGVEIELSFILLYGKEGIRDRN